MHLPRGLNRQVILLGLVSLFADISSEMLTPVTPLFLTAVLGASAFDVGVIEGFAEATASLLKTFSGAWSDRIGRRKVFIVFGYLSAALAKPLIGWAGSWPQVLAARLLDRLGKGVRGAPRDALLADAVPAEERGRAFGWHRLMDTLGAVIGSLLAVGLITLLAGDLRRVYFIAFIPALLSVAMALLVRESRERAQARVVGRGRALPGAFKSYLVVWGIFCLGNSSDAFLVLRAQAAGYSSMQTIYIYCVYNLIYALASPYLGAVADRFGRKRVLASGLLVFAGVYCGFAWAPASWLVGLFAVYGLYAAATDGVGKALAVDLLPAEARAYGLGALGTVTGIGALAASVLAGGLWESVGPAAAFAFGAVGAVAAAVGLVFVPPVARRG